MGIAAHSPWIVCRRRDFGAAIRLFCFPYAGAGASIFSKWSEFLGPAIELDAIQLPGHETRMAEPPATDLKTLLRELAEVLAPSLGGPFAFLGHSMGALIAFELARLLRKELGREPERVFLSGLRAVQLSDPDPPLYSCSDQCFLDELSRRYGLPKYLLEHPELLELFVPLLRADFQMCESYRYVPDRALECPFSIFGGLNDLKVSRDALTAWQFHTTKPLKLRMLEGDHYFFETSWARLAQFVAEDIQTVIPQPE
jgi:medium-chain acyl-[acyl-carrier-protein] hydrolase